MLLSLLLALNAAETAPSTGEARACINNQVAEGYGAGWRVRNVSAFEVSEENNRYMLLTLVADVEYRFLSCGDTRAQSVRIVVYDDSGRLIESTQPVAGRAEGRQAELSFTPPKSGSYFVGVRLVQGQEQEQVEERRRRRKGEEEAVLAPTAAIGLGVLYR